MLSDDEGEDQTDENKELALLKSNNLYKLITLDYRNEQEVPLQPT
jgi:hypothetical protein